MTLEFPVGPQKWRTIQVEVHLSRKNNYFVKHGDEVFVFAQNRNGEKILGRVNGKWQIVGRVVFGTLFVGNADQLSHDEWLRTPEGIKQTVLEFEDFKQSLLTFRR
jgi:hypothetical protein